jgi:ABC-type branched-subunit amino acid transport system substrate-binding protein
LRILSTQLKSRVIAPVRLTRPRLLYGGAALSVLMLALAACGSTASSSSTGGSASSNAPYQIGFTSGLTGQFGAVGQGVRDGAQAYFDALNASGGINGHKIKFTALDDALDPNRGVANMIQLVTQDHDIAVLGFHDSVVADAVAPEATKYKVPMIAATVDQTLVKPALPYVYAVTLQTAGYAAAQVAMAQKLMKSHTGKVRVAIMTVSDSAGNQQWANEVNSLAKSLGWNVVENLITPQDATNAAPDVAKVIAAKPDVFIMALGTDPFEIGAVKQIEQAGATFPVINYDFASWNALQSLHRVWDGCGDSSVHQGYVCSKSRPERDLCKQGLPAGDDRLQRTQELRISVYRFSASDPSGQGQHLNGRHDPGRSALQPHQP